MTQVIRRVCRNLPFVNVDRSCILSYIQALIAFIFLVGVGVMLFTTIQYARSHAAKEVVNRGTIITSILSRAAGRALDQPAVDPEAALGKVIYDIRAEEGLELAFVADGNNRVVAHSDSQMQGKVLPAGLPNGGEVEQGCACTEEGFYYTTREEGGWSGSTLYEFVRPIPLSGAARERYAGGLGLHIGLTVPGFWSFTSFSAKRLVPGLAIAFFLLVVGNYVAGVFVRPLRALSDETALAAGADDKWQLDMEASGEVAEIARNWNQMVTNFRSSYERVVQARRDLEVRNRVMLYEKKRTEAIVDSLSDGVMVIDSYGKISFVNRECENVLGLTREAAVGRVPGEVVKDAAVREFVATLPVGAGEDTAGAAAAPGRKSQKRAGEVEVERKNGTRHLRLSFVPVQEGAGKPGGGIVSIRDVTQDKLEEGARKEFISNVTHELRAPLTAIKSYVEMLIDDEAKKPELQREFFNTINEEADRLARLINDMLNMSRIEVGNLVLNKSLVRTRKLVEDAVNGMRSAAKNKGMELTATVAPDLPDIEADKEMVRVVVTNLLSNAIKYTQDGGKVYLSAELADKAGCDAGEGIIAVTVGDNGPGIPEDELDKIFEKFYRGRNAVDQKVVGNGLGLALAREIACLHGGDIKVESAVGQGSRFTFLLPARQASRKVS